MSGENVLNAINNNTNLITIIGFTLSAAVLLFQSFLQNRSNLKLQVWGKVPGHFLFLVRLSDFFLLASNWVVGMVIAVCWEGEEEGKIKS